MINFLVGEIDRPFAGAILDKIYYQDLNNSD